MKKQIEITQNNLISKSLREAEKHIGIALSQLKELGPGRSWVGSWAEYKKIAQLMVKTKSLADDLEQHENSFTRNETKRVKHG